MKEKINRRTTLNFEGRREKSHCHRTVANCTTCVALLYALSLDAFFFLYQNVSIYSISKKYTRLENQQVHKQDLQKRSKIPEKTYTTSQKNDKQAERASWKWLEEEPNQRQGSPPNTRQKIKQKATPATATNQNRPSINTII